MTIAPIENDNQWTLYSKCCGQKITYVLLYSKGVGFQWDCIEEIRRFEDAFKMMNILKDSNPDWQFRISRSTDTTKYETIE